MFGGEHAFIISQIVNVVIIVLLIAVPTAIIWRWLRTTQRSSSLDILKQRLARGELSETEYLRLRSLLRDEVPEKAKRTDETVDSTQAFAADGDTLDADSFYDRRRLHRDGPK